ncbi:Uncharacterised protein [Mycobacteroides abscessus subsp. abscessus]|nr:Uncharacterised protein [Mycobacteroides abscessus subsp. abscessus]
MLWTKISGIFMPRLAKGFTLQWTVFNGRRTMRMT